MPCSVPCLVPHSIPCSVSYLVVFSPILDSMFGPISGCMSDPMFGPMFSRMSVCQASILLQWLLTSQQCPGCPFSVPHSPRAGLSGQSLWAALGRPTWNMPRFSVQASGGVSALPCDSQQSLELTLQQSTHIHIYTHLHTCIPAHTCTKHMNTPHVYTHANSLTQTHENTLFTPICTCSHT